MFCVPTSRPTPLSLVVERRQDPRLLAPLSVMMVGTDVKGLTWDISQQGAFVVGLPNLEVGSALTLTIAFGGPSGATNVGCTVIFVRGRQAFYGPPHGMGVKFDDKLPLEKFGGNCA